MEILQIGDGKLLLSLSADDMAHYGGCGGRGECIRRLMTELDGRYGCGLTHGRLYVQMYESKKGGCEMFVTKLGDKGGDNMMRQTDERMIGEYRRYILREKRGIYEFGKMESLLFACKLLIGSGYSGKSEVYADRESGKTYLVIDEESSYPTEALGTLCDGTTEYYLREHCTKIFGERAAQILSELA